MSKTSNVLGYINPSEELKQAQRNPIWFGAGLFGGGILLNGLWTANRLPNQLLFQVGNSRITAADVGQAAVGAALGLFGSKIPIVGRMLGQGALAAAGYGLAAGVVYNKVAQFIGLPTVPAAMQVLPFGQTPFSQAYLPPYVDRTAYNSPFSAYAGTTGYGSFSGQISVQ